ncbi:Glucosidase 2 subunit beta [Penicillium paradoxum]|uniref:Glucosidase 2 subunit beta n=1 Tax=Penicillium paradoxum TaxID=176176 RepID=UPI0025490C79|nr:Glucosidase 2 subunit beta [Penicillium paradoxum]KAJ5782772.1 Glucosidase 2 subunit beta [Penicillium paradoxum]
MRLPQSLLLMAAAGSAAQASSDKPARPRGVGPEFAKFYQDATTFTCISNPSVKIPFSAVNDDFCDCPDGSDEPGTAACSHISRNSPPTVADRPGNNDLDIALALPGFYCKNKGHRPSYIPFQRINDGVCDYEQCCDCSDEWARVGGTKCEDRCKEIGKQWRKQEEQNQKSMTAALRKKKDLLVDAARQQQEIEDHIVRLEAEIQGAEVKEQNLEAELKLAQEQDRKVVRTGKGKGKVSALANLAKGRVDELRNALVDVRRQRDEIRGQAKELEDILAKFKVEYNPNFNDEGVKRAVRSYEDYAAREQTSEGGNGAVERDLDEILKADGADNGVNWEHWENEEDGCNDADLVYKLAAYLPPSLVSFIEDKIVSARSFLEDQGILPKANGDSSSESKAVTQARDALKAAQDSVSSLKNKLRDQRADLEQDYGPASIFRALKGVCISLDAGEYTYEHCFLESTKQNQRKGGNSVSMGRFSKVGTTSVEEVNEAGDVINIEKTVIEYDRGQSCWNGPSRSTKVILECGEENKILKTAEEEKCVYSMLVTSPAACAGGEEAGNAAPRSKDEL